MEDFVKIFEQLGLGAIGIILLLWAAAQTRIVYEARIADLKQEHATHLKLLGKVIGLKGDTE